MTDWYDEQNPAVQVILRIMVPVFFLIILLVTNFLYRESYLTQTRSLKAFFEITANSEYVTMILIALWGYIIFVPLILSSAMQKDRIKVSDKTNTLMIKDAKNNVFTYRIDAGTLTSNQFLKKIAGILKPNGIFVAYTNRTNKFVLRCADIFTIMPNSTMGGLLGFDPNKTYTAVATNPLSDYKISDTFCKLYEIQSESRVVLNNPSSDDNIVILSQNIPIRTIIYTVFTVLIIIWKTYSVGAYRNIGLRMNTDTITDNEIRLLNDVRVRSNAWAFVIACIFVGFILYTAITGQDVTPWQDIH